MSKQPSLPTVKKLFALSGNNCAYPRCSTALIDPEHGTVIGEICHIKAREEGGPRFDRTQTDDERRGFDNLVLMCGVHHKVIDTDVASYPVERLQTIKAKHETKHRNGLPPSDEIAEKLLGTLSVLGSIITTHGQQGGQVAHNITNIFANPPKSKASLTPVVESLLTKVDHEVGLDYYDFRVGLRNDGQKTVREFRVEVEIPRKYMVGTGSFSAEVASRNPETKLFSHTQQNFRDFALYSGDTYPVFSLSFIPKKEHYLQGITEAIKVSAYSEDEPMHTERYPIADMLNAERVETIFGPRLTALKKIYQTARDFYGAEADLTAEPVYISEGPAEGKRNVNLGENAYTMCKALVKEGWIVFENEDAMIVRLTDEGIRKAS